LETPAASYELRLRCLLNLRDTFATAGFVPHPLAFPATYTDRGSISERGYGSECCLSQAAAYENLPMPINIGSLSLADARRLIAAGGASGGTVDQDQQVAEAAVAAFDKRGG
jgi:hypothetical protein